ncbi:MAG TPA: GNAT family N-acetyltransferase [Hyphomicrobiaceae bacterium]|nr:GNAT family N-acetyltransferase [Hyphomicrobiaceae bacterium]
MTLKFHFFTRDTMPDAAVLRSAAHANRMLAEQLPDDPPYDAADELRRWHAMPSQARSQVWIAEANGNVVAEANLNWEELESNRALAHVYVSVERDWRGQGLGATLLSLAVERAIEAGRPKLMSMSTSRVPAGGRFLDRVGFTRRLEMHTNQLKVADLDRALVDAWSRPDPARTGDYAIEVFDGPVPDHRLEAYAELVGVMNTAPRGTLEVEDTKITASMVREWEASLVASGWRRLLAVTRHVPSGVLAGFTELRWTPTRASLVWQGGTGVVPSHRNRGLGRWLKAQNLAALLSANDKVRFVRTGNADSNAPMLAINHQLGFRPFTARALWQGNAAEVSGQLARQRRQAA